MARKVEHVPIMPKWVIRASEESSTKSPRLSDLARDQLKRAEYARRDSSIRASHVNLEGFRGYSPSREEGQSDLGYALALSRSAR